jgi:uncharacterized protein YoxC
MDYLTPIFAVVLIVITVVLTVVGIQMVLVLLEVRKTLKKVNTTIDTVEAKVNSIVMPFQRIGDITTNLMSGFKVFESFVGFLNRDKDSKK